MDNLTEELQGTANPARRKKVIALRQTLENSKT